MSAGVPKMGQLQNAAWTLSDTCTFKIMNVQVPNPPEKPKDDRPGSSGSSLCKLCSLKLLFNNNSFERGFLI